MTIKNCICIPETLTDIYLTLASIWAVLVSTIGILGNLLTLMAVSFAARRKRSVVGPKAIR